MEIVNVSNEIVMRRVLDGDVVSFLSHYVNCFFFLVLCKSNASRYLGLFVLVRRVRASFSGRELNCLNFVYYDKIYIIHDKMFKNFRFVLNNFF